MNGLQFFLSLVAVFMLLVGIYSLGEDDSHEL